MPHIRARNLVDLCILFKNNGVGHKFIRHSWGSQPDSYWTLTKVAIDRIDTRVNRGRVWGRLTWKGKTLPEIRIKAVNKREWAFVPNIDRCGPWERQRIRTILHSDETLPVNSDLRKKALRDTKPIDEELLDEPSTTTPLAFRKIRLDVDEKALNYETAAAATEVTSTEEVYRLQEEDSELRAELESFAEDGKDGDDNDDDDDDDDSSAVFAEDAETERLRQAESRLLE